MPKYTNEVGDIVNPKYARVIMKGNIATVAPEATVKCYNVFDFRRDNNSPPFDPENLKAAFASALQTPVLSASNEDYILGSYETRQLDDPTSPLLVSAVGVNGSSDEDLYASDTAVYMQLKTGYRGRSFMGSKHFGALSEDQVTEGYLNAGGRTAWDAVRDIIQAMGTTGITDDDGNVWRLVVLSQLNSDLEASPAIFTAAQVETVLLNDRIGTMGRRRGPRTST